MTVLWLFSKCCWRTVVRRLDGVDFILLACCGRSTKEDDLRQSLGTSRAWLQKAEGFHGREGTL